MSRGVEKETEEMQHEVMVLSKRMHERQHNRSEWRRRDFCHFQCKCLCAEALLHAELSSSMQEVERNIECMHIFAYNQQRAVLKSAACRLQAAGLYQNRRPHISVQEKNWRCPGIVVLTATLTKTRCPS